MKALTTVHNLMKSLRMGYTTVRTTGTAFQGFGMMDVKRAIDRGWFAGSRFLVAPHALGISGGHWDFSVFHTNSNPYVSEFLEQRYALTSGADAFKALVRKQIKYGAEFIKIMAAGGFASPGDDPGQPQLDAEELRAIIETAKSFRCPTMAHAYTSPVIDMLIELGIDEIEHGTLMQPHTAGLMEKHGIYFVPTIASLMPVDPEIDLSRVPPKSEAYVRKQEKYGAQLQESRKTIIDIIMDRDITVGLGSDLVAIYDSTDCWREFMAWVDIGIPPLRALVAATSANARICHLDHKTGSLKPGMLADIAAWSRDIEKDKRALSQCDFAMKEGVVGTWPPSRV
jgi:imidazolonepropionase-like amidohydrolase